MTISKRKRAILKLKPYAYRPFISHICQPQSNPRHRNLLNKRPQTPLNIHHNIQPHQILRPDLHILLTLLKELRVILERLLNLLIPVLRLPLIIMLHHIFGRERHYLLETNYKHVWLITLIKG